MAEKVYYYIADRESSAIVANTNTRIIDYLRDKDPLFPIDAKLYAANVSLNVVWNQLRNIVLRLFELAKAADADEDADVTEYALDCADDFPHWDMKGRVVKISAPPQEHILDVAEASVANLLLHAKIVLDHVAELTLTMHRVSGGNVWPSIACCFHNSKWGDMKRRAEALKQLLSDYIRDMMVDINDSRKCDQAQGEIERLLKWRNKRAHELHYYVTMEAPPLDVIFSSTLNKFVYGVGLISFGACELSCSLKRLEEFLAWWCWHSENYTGKHSISWEHPPMQHLKPQGG